MNRVELRSALGDFLSCVEDEEEYFILGSVALLARIGPHHYSRDAKDIDIIVSPAVADKVENGLRNRGYKRGTFIDEKMPFAKQLQKDASTRYVRFSKGNAAIELLVSDATHSTTGVEYELVTGFFCRLPDDATTEAHFEGLTFRALTAEALYCIYQIGLRTYGRFVKKGVEQRRRDVDVLRHVVDEDKKQEFMNAARIRVCGIWMRLPRVLAK